jgi:dephospho-CoA kinase
MKVLGLTGGVGMGKSTAAKLLEAWGVAVVDTDLLARQVVEPRQPALDEIKELFGPGTVSSDGTLRREELARLVFADADARKKLERIVHPRIRERWLDQIDLWRKANRSLAAVVIPLLFETKAESEFDAVLCVACSEETQFERLSSRGWTRAQIEQRVRAQWPVTRKMNLADHVVWTEGELDAHAEQLKRILHAAG